MRFFGTGIISTPEADSSRIQFPPPISTALRSNSSSNPIIFVGLLLKQNEVLARKARQSDAEATSSGHTPVHLSETQHELVLA